MTTNNPTSGNTPGLPDEATEVQLREVLARLDAVQIWIMGTALEMNKRGELTFDAAVERIKSEMASYDTLRRLEGSSQECRTRCRTMILTNVA